MEKKEIYYVYKSEDGFIGRVAKFVDNIPYGWDNGKWIYMPGLIKIQFEVTDYYEISKEEAEQIIRDKESV